MSNYYLGTDLNGDYYISHHGIKGQKWGVRRFQNPDGTLTDAGSKRYGSFQTHGREKKIGEGSSIAEKGRKIGTSGPIGGTSSIKVDRPKWVDPNIGTHSGVWQNAAKYINDKRTYSKLADWWGKDEADRLKTARDFQEIAEYNAYAASVNDVSLNDAYEDLQAAIDAYEENPTEANHKKYDQLLDAYMSGVEKHQEHQQLILDAQAYVKKCEADAAKTPAFKVYAVAQIGKIYVGERLQKAKKVTSSFVKKLLS